MRTKVYVLSAFTKNGEGGNPAGVVLDTKDLTEKDMQVIASTLGFSETAFIFPSTNSDYKIRYFTPNEEVDVCGHATVATFSLLAQRRIIHPGIYTTETKAGVLHVQNFENHRIFLQQNPPSFLEILPSKDIIGSLRINEDQLMPNMPIQIVSTGLRDIIVPVKSLKDLLEIDPDMEGITKISKKYNVTGYHLFTLETLHDSTAHCRNFAPLYDIPEESATGTSNAALACYLVKYNDKKKSRERTFTFEQGYTMNSSSEITVNVSVHLGDITYVQVGGSASTFQEKWIDI
ncbi:PhzF family phenazine biosynthesis protein [Brevibacillus sp. DP1.3A]|uniref:PhzF family phenazine biosynthesis protein n=1 Tax=Brevibacillus sp. DP1.3A TaxID=2738867 RepID=UPI00156BCAEB|nr:PhzF family phenazine biosynthesis protein [Brevibacillus sp. DP1.3A]UED72220.1 PhzF family phenazine biosynthesis protein [Brevibacillus sp. DP1.3A]